ncbi:hypothetical protein GCM10007161_13240 [Ignatzschineria indica]|uniref:DUF1364 domain-containing protein n=1 Tax=Ignatzschineria indica TaxID=472583 RepID=A0A2U2AJT1_9GAMM|nr:hypothetical protein DC082_06545 [Ignatzschineria indica]GGZ83134.1 hypothetical protein GCM10007161_13240 [Ignatzschineria indica]
MNRQEIKALIQSVIDDPKYIDTATERFHIEIQEIKLPDLRQWLLDGNVPCMIRLNGCQGVGDQRAHVRIAGNTGMGFKAPDPIFAWSCSHCHQKTESDPDMRVYLMDGVARTLFLLTKSLPIVCANDVTRKKSNKGMA